MELRTTSTCGSDTNCRGSLPNQLSGRRTRPTDFRRVSLSGRLLSASFHKWTLSKDFQPARRTLPYRHHSDRYYAVAQAPAPSQVSARHVRQGPASAVHAQPAAEATQSRPSQPLSPIASAGQSDSQQQPAQQIHEAYNLDTFLKERDACGVRDQSTAKLLNRPEVQR